MSSTSPPPPAPPLQTPFEELDEFITGLLKHRIDVDELLSRVMQGLERVTGEVFRQVRDFDLDPQSIILNLPPFLSSTLSPSPAPLPPPPPPAPEVFHRALFRAIKKQVEDHPRVAVGLGVGLVGLGLGVGRGVGRRWSEGRRRGWEGKVVDGFMVDAVLIICPNAPTPLLYPLILTLLKNQYVVLLGLPDLDLVEDVERWLKGLGDGMRAGAGPGGGKAGGEGKGGGGGMVLGQGVWVGVLDCDDPTSVQAFHRSVYAAMTTRYPSVLSSTTATAPRHSMSSWASGKYGVDRKPVSQKYAPLPRHLPRLKHVFNLYGLGSGQGRAAGRAGQGEEGEEGSGVKRRDRVPPIPTLLRSPTSYSSYVSMGTSAASASAAYVSGSNEDGLKPGSEAEVKEQLRLFTFVPARTLWPISREFDRQLDTVENLLLGRNALAESSARGKEKRRGEVVGVGRHVEVYVGDLRGALEGLDLRKLLAPRIRARGSRVDWFDKAPSREFWKSDSMGVRVLAPLRLGLDVLMGTASWPWRKLVAQVQKTKRERRRRTAWDSVEDGLLSGMKRSGWGLGLGVVGLGQSSVWPYILASVLPTRILAFLLKNTPIVDTLPSYLPPTRSFASSFTSPTTPNSASSSDGVPRPRGRDTPPKNPRSEPSPERQSSEGTGTGTMPSLGDSFMSSRSTDGMDASWVGVDGSR